MALVWKVRTVPLSEVEDEGTGTWEPFAITLEDGVALLHVKGMVDVDDSEKASENSGSLTHDW